MKRGVIRIGLLCLRVAVHEIAPMKPGLLLSLSSPWQKSSSVENAGESACATTLDQQFAEQGGAGIQPAGLLPRAPSDVIEVQSNLTKPRHALTVRGVGYRFVSNPGAA
jgi:hypothetical protein